MPVTPDGGQPARVVVTDEELPALFLYRLIRSGVGGEQRALRIIREYGEERARVERQRTLADARAFIAHYVRDIGADGAVGANSVYRAFSRWVLDEGDTLADPDRRLCFRCGQRHTDQEHGHTHRTDEGGL
jgi:hypothetical protein